MSLQQPPKALTTTEPRGSMEMTVSHDHNNPKRNCQHTQEASRLRGGGAGKDCILGILGCFLCCECFEGCCDCIADILCCPCEMCC